MNVVTVWSEFHKPLYYMETWVRFFLSYDNIQKEKMTYFKVKFSVSKYRVLRVLLCFTWHNIKLCYTWNKSSPSKLLKKIRNWSPVLGCTTKIPVVILCFVYVVGTSTFSWNIWISAVVGLLDTTRCGPRGRIGPLQFPLVTPISAGDWTRARFKCCERLLRGSHSSYSSSKHCRALVFGAEMKSSCFDNIMHIVRYNETENLHISVT